MCASNRGTLTPIVVDFMHKRRVAEVLLDFCLITFCYYTAYRLRFEDPDEFLLNFATFTRSLPVVLAAQMIAFFAVGVYRGVWRHFGMMDSLVIARGVFFGTVGAELFILYVYHFFAYSRTVFAVYAVLLLIAVTLSRASFRLLGEFVQRQRQSGVRVVIYGAGDDGGLVIREVFAGDGDAKILGFIDDDPRKAGIRVEGYPVLGGSSALTVLAKAGAVDRIVICAPPDAARAAEQPRSPLRREQHQPAAPEGRPRSPSSTATRHTPRAPARGPSPSSSHRHQQCAASAVS